MKFISAFVLGFLATLMIAFAIPTVRSAATNNLLAYIKREYKLEVEGNATWSFFPLTLHLNEVRFETFETSSLDIGLGTLSLTDGNGLKLKGSFWLDLHLEPYGTFSLLHPDFGSSTLSFFSKVEKNKTHLTLNIEGTTPFGQISAEGSLKKPKKGFASYIEEGRALLSRWKVSWEGGKLGSSVGYVTLGYENGSFTLPSLEAAGVFLGKPFTVEAAGELEHPLVDFELKPIEGSFGSLTFSDGHLSLNLYRNEQAWQGDVALKGQMDGLPLQAKAIIEMKEGESLSLKEGVIAFDGGAGSFDGEFHVDSRQLDLSVTLATDALSHFLSVEGDLLAHAVFSGRLDEAYLPLAPQLKIQLYSNRLENPLLMFVDGEISLEFSEKNGSPSWNILGKAPHGRIQGETFEDITFSSVGTTGDLSPLNLNMRQGKEILSLRGEVSPSLEGVRLFIQSVEGKLWNLPISLKDTAFLSFYQDGWHLDRFHLAFGKTTLKLGGRGGKGEVALQGELPTLNLKELRPSLSGSGSGTLELFGPWNDLEGLLSLRISDFDVQSFDYPLFPLDATFSARLSKDEAHLKAKFVGLQGEQLEGEGRIFFTEFFPIDGRLSFNGDLSPLLSLLVPDTTSVSGPGRGVIRVQGTLDAPKLSGSLELRRGIYEDLISGMLYRDMEAKFLFNENKITIEGLRALDRMGGKITGEGEFIFDAEGQRPFHLNLEATSAELIHLDYVIASATGSVVLSGNKDGGLFKGDLQIDKMSIDLPEKTPILLQKLDVVYERIEPRPVKEPWPLSWDLHILADHPITVDGSVFSSTWRGDFNLTGTTDAPLLFGKGKLSEANFTFNGKTFNSKDGMILFQGEPSSKTSFYVTAKEEIEDVKIEIILKGPIKSPELTFRSNPPKPTKEILSYLLFNRGTGDLAYEGAELSQSSIKLDSAPSSPDLSFLDKLKSSLGIDRIDIRGDNENDPQSVSVEVGKYLSPSLYFCLKKSVSDGPNQAAIVAKLPYHFKAEGEMGDDAEGKFMLKWERDY